MERPEATLTAEDDALAAEEAALAAEQATDKPQQERPEDEAGKGVAADVLQSLGVESEDELKQLIKDGRNKKEWASKYDDMGEIYNELKRTQKTLAELMKSTKKPREFQLPADLQGKVGDDELVPSAKWAIGKIQELEETLVAMGNQLEAFKTGSTTSKTEEMLEMAQNSYIEKHPEIKDNPNLDLLFDGILLKVARLPLNRMSPAQVKDVFQREMDAVFKASPSLKTKPKLITGGKGGGGGGTDKVKKRSEMTDEERRAADNKYLDEEEAKLKAQGIE